MMETQDRIPDWLHERKLPPHVSLQVLSPEGQVLYESGGKWLHPLMEVEAFLARTGLDPRFLILHDRIAGRAAASLGVRMGFRIVKLCLMSRLAERVYLNHDVCYEADGIVERIACKTEDLIDDSMDLDEVHALIHRRAEAAKLARSNKSD